MMDTVAAFAVYADMLGTVLPCAFAFAACNLLVNLFVNAFMHGRFKFGGK